MITISGVCVTRESGAPTLHDIGYSLSQLPRFAGHITRPWSVLNHVYACSYYAALEHHSTRTQLDALLHDADESCTNDIPQPWKTDETRMLQQTLRTRIYASLHLSQPSLWTERIVHQIDNQMVYVEAKRFAPQVADALLRPGPDFRDGIRVIDPNADAAVEKSDQWLFGLGPQDAAFDFETFVHQLMEKTV
jgi:hypothetical protein